MKFTDKNLACGIILFNVLMLLGVWFYFPGTGDDGDSVQHYMYARWAFRYPEHFFNQWAKPVYVLITSPIAQLGFKAIKLFNIFLYGLTMFIAYQIAVKLNVRNAWLVPLFSMIAPMQFYLIPSGLTEPMWAFWFVTTIYLAVNNRLLAATIWLSFLPFVRSEGLIILCVFAPYLLFKRKFWMIPFLYTGHLVYMLAGAKYHGGNIWWVFTKMSYATMSSAYGIGKWFHFMDGLRPFMGSGARLFLVIGLIYGAWRMINYWFGKAQISKEELWLIYGTSVAYFIGHSAFWALGIFNSFGLLRVLVGVMPTFAIIITQGYTWAWDFFKEKNVKLGWLYVGISAALILHSSYKMFSLGNLELSGDQIATKKAIEAHRDKLKDATLYFDNTSLAFFLDTDYFSDKEHRHTDRLKSGEPIPENALIFWDDWYSPVEAKVTLEDLQNNFALEQIGRYEGKNPVIGPARYVYVFRSGRSAVTVKDTLWKNDFENEIRKDVLSTKLAFSGKYSNEVAAGHDFSLGYAGPMSALRNSQGVYKVRITAKVFLANVIENKSPFIVAEISRNGQVSKWRGLKLNNHLKTPNQWLDFSTLQTFDVEATDEDIIKIYFWNEHDNPMYVDDFKIEVIE